VSPGTRLENLVANHLLREVNFLEDTKGARLKLYTLRDKEKREIDFVITEREQPIRFIEVKQSDTDISGSLFYYKNKFPKAEFVQVVQQLHQGRSKQGIRVIPLTEYLLSLAS
jgi:predicted AAA+ superfamily ATPase